MQVLTQYSEEDFKENRYGRAYYCTDFEIKDKDNIVQCCVLIQENGKYYHDKETDYFEFESKGFEVEVYSLTVYDKDDEIIKKVNEEEIIKKIKKLLSNG